MESNSFNNFQNDPNDVEAQHFAYLKSQITLPSPIQPPHHDNAASSSTSQLTEKQITGSSNATAENLSTRSNNDNNAMTPANNEPPTPSSNIFQSYTGPMTPRTPITPMSVDSQIVPQLQNIVSTVDLGCKLDLKKIALHARNAEYNPKRFAAVIMRIREPRTTALIFSSGKMVCTGAKSEDMSRLAARKYARIVQKLGFEVYLIFKSLIKFKII